MSMMSKALYAAALLAISPLSHAVADPAHDLLATFAGSPTSTDLDVLDASVTYNAATDTFVLSSTMDGPVGTTAKGLYVWGVNRGAGSAGFASNHLDGVLFDRVIAFNAAGVGNIGGVGPLAAGAVTVSGNTISVVISGAALPSTGFDKQDYTWNLWPRDSAFGGFPGIADFAPNNSNLQTTAVPEPAACALMLAGLLAVVAASGRSRRAD